MRIIHYVVALQCSKGDQIFSVYELMLHFEQACRLHLALQCVRLFDIKI